MELKIRELNWTKTIIKMPAELTDSGHVLGREVLGDSLLVGDVVVDVVAPRLHGRHVQVD